MVDDGHRGDALKAKVACKSDDLVRISAIPDTRFSVIADSVST
jgi:hypothetical protein